MDKKNFKELYSKLADISDVSLDIWNSEDFIELAQKETGRSETEIWEAVTKMQLGQEKFSNLLEGIEAHDVNEEMVSTVIHDTVDMRLKPYHGAERHAMLIELLRAGSKMLDKELKESDVIKLSRLSTEKLEHHLETNMQNILEKLLLESLDKACESFQKDDFEPSDDNISQGALAGALYMKDDFVQKMPECGGYRAEMGRQIVSLGEKILNNLEFVAIWVICLACMIIIGCLIISAFAFASETFGYAVAYLFEIPWAKVVESFVFFMTLFSKELKVVLGIGAGAAAFLGVVKIIKSLYSKNEKKITVVKDEHISIKDEEYEEDDEDTLLDILKKGMENQVTDQKELNETEVENKDEDDDVFEYEDDEEDDFF